MNIFNLSLQTGSILVLCFGMRYAGTALTFTFPLIILWLLANIFYHSKQSIDLKKSIFLKLTVAFSVFIISMIGLELTLLTYTTLVRKQPAPLWLIPPRKDKKITTTPDSKEPSKPLDETEQQREMFKEAGWDVPRHLWKKKITVEGAQHAYLWMGNIHTHGEKNIRRIEPFPQKTQEKVRIAVFGDSFTYGQGVSAKEAYPALLEKKLQEAGHSVEVFNLGVCGASSEKILDLLIYFYQKLEPDIVLYGICMNDILPDDYWRIIPFDQSWAFPLPSSIKSYYYERTISVKFLDRMYNQILLKTGLRLTYRANLNKNAEKFAPRFKSDLSKMKNFIEEKTGENILTMVLNQYPMKKDKLTEQVENLVVQSGLNLIPSSPYMEKYDGENWTVHIAERHPNTKAHDVYASIFAEYLLQNERLNNRSESY